MNEFREECLYNICFVACNSTTTKIMKCAFTFTELTFFHWLCEKICSSDERRAWPNGFFIKFNEFLKTLLPFLSKQKTTFKSC